MGNKINIDDNLIVEKYDEIKNTQKVAEYFGVSKSTILRKLKNSNVKVTGRTIELDNDDVVKCYLKLKNIHKVAEYFSVSIGPIQRILKNSNLELTNRRYDVNHNYFDNIDTEERAYWLGFLFADGYIRERKSGKSLEIKLSVKDLEHLQLFKNSLNSKHKIVESVSKVKYKGGESTSKMCHLAMYSSKLVESIKKQGIHSRKTFTITRPNIEPELMNHFIRGYFDGDGSFIFIEKQRSTSTFACASKDFRDFLIEELVQNGVDIRYYGGIQLNIQNKIDNHKFYNYIYKNATIFLKRKKDIYDRFRKYYGYDN